MSANVSVESMCPTAAFCVCVCHTARDGRERGPAKKPTLQPVHEGSMSNGITSSDDVMCYWALWLIFSSSQTTHGPAILANPGELSVKIAQAERHGKNVWVTAGRLAYNAAHVGV